MADAAEFRSGFHVYGRCAFSESGDLELTLWPAGCSDDFSNAEQRTDCASVSARVVVTSFLGKREISIILERPRELLRQ